MTAPACNDVSAIPSNRLTIAHLMLWMLGSSVALAFHRMQWSASSQAAPKLWLAASVLAVVGSLPSGAELGSVALWVYRRWRGIAGFPTQPGHWLLLVGGFTNLFGWCYFTAFAIAFDPLQNLAIRSNWDLDLLRFSLMLGPPAVVCALAYGVALHAMRYESRLWNVAIGALIVECACSYCLAAAGLIYAIFSGRGDSEMAFIYPFQTGYVVFGLINSVLTIWAAIADPRRRDRDFLHWTGIAAAFAGTLLQLTALIVFTLLQR